VSPAMHEIVQGARTRMPSMVSDVSAMLVARTTLRAPGGVGSKIFACTFQHDPASEKRWALWKSSVLLSGDAGPDAAPDAEGWLLHLPADPTAGLRRWAR
jgi:hypothetical protein